MPIHATVIWMTLVYVSGQPGDLIECKMSNMFGVQATKSVRLKEPNESIRFYVPEDQAGGVEFACSKSQREHSQL